MKNRDSRNNYAFIDSQNVNLGIQELGWKLDWRRFRVYLTEKYGIRKAFLFLGFVSEYQDLYKSLQESGFILIFKPTFRGPEGKVKGNVDAELVLQAMIEYNHYDRALIVTGDGDFYCLVKYLREKGKLLAVLAPNMRKYSALLKQAAKNQLAFMNDLRQKLAYNKEKDPVRTEPYRGLFVVILQKV